MKNELLLCLLCISFVLHSMDNDKNNIKYNDESEYVALCKRLMKIQDPRLPPFSFRDIPKEEEQLRQLVQVREKELETLKKNGL
jgi:hypothetical protein